MHNLYKCMQMPCLLCLGRPRNEIPRRSPNPTTTAGMLIITKRSTRGREMIIMKAAGAGRQPECSPSSGAGAPVGLGEQGLQSLAPSCFVVVLVPGILISPQLLNPSW